MLRFERRDRSSTLLGSTKMLQMDNTKKHICFYCGQNANYQLKNGRWCCHSSQNSCPEIKRRVSSGLKGHKAWNKGLESPRKGKNKYNDPVIAKSVSTRMERISNGQIKPKTGFHHSEETKEKLRKIRFEYLSKKLGKTAWERRNSGEMSYIEQWFFDNIIQKYNLSEKFDIVNEYAVYPYFLDFALVEQKVDFELDSSYHLRRKEYDEKRDNYLNKLGWIIYRISSTEIKKSSDQLEKEIVQFIETLELKEKKLKNRLYSYHELKKDLKSQKTEKWKNILKEREQIKESILNTIIEIKKLGIDTRKQRWKREYKQLTGKDIHQRFNEIVKKYAPEEYSLFYSTTSTAGKCWMTNDTEKQSKLVSKEEVNDYKILGWYIGRKYYK